MPGFRDLTGMSFGRLVAVAFVGRVHRNSVWMCSCECGRMRAVSLANLTSGRTRSCGCLRRDYLDGVRRNPVCDAAARVAQ